MSSFDGWEPIQDSGDPPREKILGRGGQGTVYLVRSPERVQQRRRAAEELRKQLSEATAKIQHRDVDFSRFAQTITSLGATDPSTSLGALKHFNIKSGDQQEDEQAIGRLKAEVQALSALRNNRSVLKLLHANVSERFIVTEYHPSGTLDKHLNRYRGNALAALEAFSPLVDAVWEIHKQQIIHRDIKPENIFVAESGELVLGDFGIVFFQESSGDRLTRTVERVGSHEWMPPWAYPRVRLEAGEVGAALDLFPLAKILWSMIAGRNGFPFWEHRRDETNLERLFPRDPAMPLVNRILDKYVVREQVECDLSAYTFRARVDDLIRQLKGNAGGSRLIESSTWPCGVCAAGVYKQISASIPGIIPGPGAERIPFSVYKCDNCGNAQLFG